MKIIVFSGAGISRESGLLTFRDSKDGLWEGHDVMAVASIRGWWQDPQRVLDFYNMRRRDVRAASPNDAHVALAELEAMHDVTVITQNVDNLHERAGSTKVIHLHGEVLKAHADFEGAPPIDWIDDLNLGDADPATGIQLRPHIVWFGEGLDALPEALEIALAPDVDLLIVVGTTLNVYPAAMIATETKAKRVILVDPMPPDLDVENLRVIPESATVGIRRVVEELKQR
jgi:NAD-dependent deacetylase